jgi:hypothetical protein
MEVAASDKEEERDGSSVFVFVEVFFFDGNRRVVKTLREATFSPHFCFFSLFLSREKEELRTPPRGSLCPSPYEAEFDLSLALLAALRLE